MHHVSLPFISVVCAKCIVKLVPGRVSRISHARLEIFNGDNFAQMLRDGFPDNYCHDSQWSLHYVLPDIAYQGAIMRIVKKGLHGLRTMCSCLARAPSQK